MKTFELASKKNKNGRRKFKAILYEIFPDKCIDEKNKVGTQYNENGITWIRKYCEEALPSIKGMSLRCEFLDEERTELCGHGETAIEDGTPIFENADVVGHFTNGYISDIITEDGTKKTVCIGEGEIDGFCYNNFVKKLEEDIANDNAPHGSIEILKTNGNSGIVYKYGYKEKGRIPTVFEHSGYALLGVKPADEAAKILELNRKEDINQMNENDVRALITQTVNELLNHQSEIENLKKEYEENIKSANKLVSDIKSEKEEAVASSEKMQQALNECKEELAEANAKVDKLCEENSTLHKELDDAKAAEKINALNAAMSSFSDDEKEYAKSEIEAFKEHPLEADIEFIVNKIWEGIGKKAREATVASEQNAAKNYMGDIFGEVGALAPKSEDVNIF